LKVPSRRGKINFDLKEMATETNLLGSIIHVIHNIKLKIAPWSPEHYDIIDEIQIGRFWNILVVLFHK